MVIIERVLALEQSDDKPDEVEQIKEQIEDKTYELTPDECERLTKKGLSHDSDEVKNWVKVNFDSFIRARNDAKYKTDPIYNALFN